MSQSHTFTCDCGAVEFTVEGAPKVRGFCHCADCRNFLKVPYHSVDVWDKEQLTIDKGADKVSEFQHPDKQMKRFFCSDCGDTVFNSNRADWRIVSQLLVRRNNGGELPEELAPQSHFYYGERIVDIDDGLPKKE